MAAPGKHRARTSDRLFLEAALQNGKISRAGAAEALGVSKPTASEAVERLVEAKLLQPAGQKTGTKGRAAKLFEPSQDFGCALVLVARSGELVTGHVDLAGHLHKEHRSALPRDLAPEQLVSTVTEHLTETSKQSPEWRCVIAAVAVPVDPRTSRPRPDAETPFPAADIDLVDVMKPWCSGPIIVDNDVNWAALWACEKHPPLQSGVVLHVYLGAGLGAALTIDAHIHPGRRGAFGEIGQLKTQGHSVTAALGELGVLGRGSHYIDVERCVQTIETDPVGEAVCAVLAEAIGNATTLLDPDHLVLTGPLTERTATSRRILAAVEERLGPDPTPVTMLTSDVDVVRSGAVVGARRTMHQLARESLGSIPTPE